MAAEGWFQQSIEPTNHSSVSGAMKDKEETEDDTVWTRDEDGDASVLRVRSLGTL